MTLKGVALHYSSRHPKHLISLHYLVFLKSFYKFLPAGLMIRKQKIQLQWFLQVIPFKDDFYDYFLVINVILMLETRVSMQCWEITGTAKSAYQHITSNVHKHIYTDSFSYNSHGSQWNIAT